MIARLLANHEQVFRVPRFAAALVKLSEPVINVSPSMSMILLCAFACLQSIHVGTPCVCGEVSRPVFASVLALVEYELNVNAAPVRLHKRFRDEGAGEATENASLRARGGRHDRFCASPVRREIDADECEQVDKLSISGEAVKSRDSSEMRHLTNPKGSATTA